MPLTRLDSMSYAEELASASFAAPTLGHHWLNSHFARESGRIVAAYAELRSTDTALSLVGDIRRANEIQRKIRVRQDAGVEQSLEPWRISTRRDHAKTHAKQTRDWVRLECLVEGVGGGKDGVCAVATELDDVLVQETFLRAAAVLN